MSEDAVEPSPPASILPATIRLFALMAAILLGLGLIAPSMTIITSFGKYDQWIRLFAPDIAAEEVVQYSIISGIFALFDSGNWGIGLILLVFSCFFPTLKLMLMAWANENLAAGGRPGKLLAFAHHAGKFSMLDVLVIALLILAIKGMPGDSELILRWGIWAFASSVILSLIASLLLQRLSRKSETTT